MFLQTQLRTIVAEQCDSVDYVDLYGKHITGVPRGCVLTVFCVYAGEKDAYKVTLRMIQNHVLINLDKITVEAGVHRFNELNKLLMWCWSRKHL